MILTRLLDTVRPPHHAPAPATVLNVRADSLTVGERIQDAGDQYRIRSVQVEPFPTGSFVFLRDDLSRLRVYEGDEMVPVRLAGGAL